MKRSILLVLSLVFVCVTGHAENIPGAEKVLSAQVTAVRSPNVSCFERTNDYVIFIEGLSARYPDPELIMLNGDTNNSYALGCRIDIKRTGEKESSNNYCVIFHKPVDSTKVKTEKYYNGAVVYIPKRTVLDEEKTFHYNESKKLNDSVLAAGKMIVIFPGPEEGYKKVDDFLFANSLVKGANNLVKEKDFENAILKYDKAMGYDPDNALIPYNTAVCYYRLGDIKKAVENAEKAVAADPDMMSWQFFLGDMYFKSKDYKKTLSKYEEILSLFPTMPKEKLNKCYRRLFQVCAILGESKSAFLYGEKIYDKTKKEAELLNTFVDIVKNDKEKTENADSKPTM